MQTSDKANIFTIDDDFINQWFDTFDPSIKTFVIDFSINKLKPYNFNIDLIEDEEEKHFASILANHFASFLQLKIMDANPGHLITGCELLPPNL